MTSVQDHAMSDEQPAVTIQDVMVVVGRLQAAADALAAVGARAAASDGDAIPTESTSVQSRNARRWNCHSSPVSRRAARRTRFSSSASVKNAPCVQHPSSPRPSTIPWQPRP